ncbi:MAG: type II toxin-antitoxin system VapC family toxin [Anaerolineae bacterium]|nr:type II toxin-antitoxin system VapC family toxin [Anaerolineae bacterium]
MTAYFLDTSALAKRYLVETGSGWIKSFFLPTLNQVIVISELTPVEMFSLLARRQREGYISPQDAAAFQADFWVHFEKQYLVVNLESPILLQARSLVTNHKLRTLDAIQLASAAHATNILGEPLTFLPGDVDLLTAASNEGFVVDNPNAHP